MDYELQYRKVINLEVFRQIQESHFIATGFASVFADEYGNELGGGSGYCDFCNLMQSRPEGKEGCRLSDYLAGERARKLGKPYIYKCHAGLIDIAIPIVVQGHFMGTMLTGQVKCIESEFETLDKIPSKKDWLQDPQYKKLYDKIETASRKRIEATAHTFFLMVNSLVEKHISEIVQEQLLAEKEKLIRETQIRHELEKSLKEAQLRALQQQINPHFIFNILNSISVLVRLEQLDKAQAVIGAFTKMLRYSLNKTNTLVSLEEELEYISQYLFIQNLRFGNRILYEMEIDPCLSLIKIPFFSLQPLVENAVIHGLEPKEDGGKVKISAKIEGKNVLISVQDNGLGIPENEAREIQNHLSLESDSHRLNIGMLNVHKRLKLLYGDDYSIQIQSREGFGTVVNIIIKKADDIYEKNIACR
jgi:LytS/YehU family sensor histidine kinase